jgi:DNA (cytosine-5)-methyltransferase 1
VRVGSLCSGIGGIDLGLERAGMEIAWQSETDPYASSVLAKHWPNTPNLGDLKRIEWSSVEPVDLVCGGYPCQGESTAGLRLGAADERWLWPWIAEGLGVLRPRWALFENVAAHTSGTFWRVLGDLAALGFDVEWETLPAAAFGAPHLRYRLFIVAHAPGGGDRGEVLGGEAERSNAIGSSSRLGRPSDGGGTGPVAHAQRDGLEGSGGAIFTGPRWGRSAVCGWWSVEPSVGRVAHGVPNRVDRLRCLGNAVVPQVAEWIGRRIMTAALSNEGGGDGSD